MDLNTIKKELYKQKPDAIFIKATKQGLLYFAALKNMEDSRPGVYFIVPLSDIGDATFDNRIESQLLIRYIVTPETTI